MLSNNEILWILLPVREGPWRRRDLLKEIVALDLVHREQLYDHVVLHLEVGQVTVINSHINLVPFRWDVLNHRERVHVPDFLEHEDFLPENRVFALPVPEVLLVVGPGRLIGPAVAQHLSRPQLPIVANVRVFVLLGAVAQVDWLGTLAEVHDGDEDLAEDQLVALLLQFEGEQLLPVGGDEGVFLMGEEQLEFDALGIGGRQDGLAGLVELVEVGQVFEAEVREQRDDQFLVTLQSYQGKSVNAPTAGCFRCHRWGCLLFFLEVIRR